MNYSQWRHTYPADNPRIFHYNYGYQQHGYPHQPNGPGLFPYDDFYNPIQEGSRQQIRRETGHYMMTGIWKGFPMHREPKQGVRPMIIVPPRAIGPILSPSSNDVLCGRGGRINSHPGNTQFRELVRLRKKDYLKKSTKKLEKAHIAASIVHQIRRMNPPGRFLKEEKDGVWFDVGDKKAIKKAGQALREDAQEVRQNMGDDNSTSDDNDDDDVATECRTAGDEHGEPKCKVNTGKKVRTTRLETESPLASQDVSVPTMQKMTDALMPAPQVKFRKFSPETAAKTVSAAAAAAIEPEPCYYEVAFGRPFHPPVLGVDMPVEESIISGLSEPLEIPIPPAMNVQREKATKPIDKERVTRSSEAAHFVLQSLEEHSMDLIGLPGDEIHDEMSYSMMSTVDMHIPDELLACPNPDDSRPKRSTSITMEAADLISLASLSIHSNCESVPSIFSKLSLSIL